MFQSLRAGEKANSCTFLYMHRHMNTEHAITIYFVHFWACIFLCAFTHKLCITNLSDKDKTLIGQVEPSALSRRPDYHKMWGSVKQSTSIYSSLPWHIKFRNDLLTQPDSYKRCFQNSKLDQIRIREENKAKIRGRGNLHMKNFVVSGSICWQKRENSHSLNRDACMQFHHHLSVKNLSCVCTCSLGIPCQECWSEMPVVGCGERWQLRSYHWVSAPLCIDCSEKICQMRLETIKLYCKAHQEELKPRQRANSFFYEFYWTQKHNICELQTDPKVFHKSHVQGCYFWALDLLQMCIVCLCLRVCACVGVCVCACVSACGCISVHPCPVLNSRLYRQLIHTIHTFWSYICVNYISSGSLIHYCDTSQFAKQRMCKTVQSRPHLPSPQLSHTLPGSKNQHKIPKRTAF